MTEAKYLRSNLPTLSEQLEDRGHEACPTTVGTLLREGGDDLYVNVKRFTGPPHPDRDPQFRYLAGLVEAFRDAGLPILSVDTPQCAAEAVARWWARIGCHRYRGAGDLLVLADSGGSNGYRPRIWKWGLPEWIADRYGLRVTVCHYRPGRRSGPLWSTACWPPQRSLGGRPVAYAGGDAGVPPGHNDRDRTPGDGGVVGAPVTT